MPSRPGLAGNLIENEVKAKKRLHFFGLDMLSAVLRGLEIKKAPIPGGLLHPDTLSLSVTTKREYRFRKRISTKGVDRFCK